MSMMRVGRRALLICAALSALAGCGRQAAAPGPQAAASPATAVSVRFPIPIVESGQSPFYLAADRGYYKAEGLAVSFQMGSPELNPIKMVTAGQDTFGVIGGPDTLILARSQGQPLKALAILHRNSNFSCLLTRADSGITKVQQLNGKRVGFYYGHISTDVLRSLFRQTHVKPVEVDVGFNYNPLISGDVAAEWAFTVTAGIDLPAHGVAVNIISPADYGIITHGYVIFAREDTIREHPQMVLAFLRASLKGVAAAVANATAANDALLRRAPTLDRDLSFKRQLAYNAVTSDSEAYPPGYMDHAMFAATYARLRAAGVLTHEFNIDDVYDPSFLRQLGTSLVSRARAQP